MALDGSYSVLYSFSGDADGYEPSYAGLVQGIGGDFYDLRLVDPPRRA